MDQHNKTTDEVSEWNYNYAYKENHIEITNTYTHNVLFIAVLRSSLTADDDYYESVIRKKKINFESSLPALGNTQNVSFAHILLVAENQLWRMIIQL